MANMWRPSVVGHVSVCVCLFEFANPPQKKNRKNPAKHLSSWRWLWLRSIRFIPTENPNIDLFHDLVIFGVAIDVLADSNRFEASLKKTAGEPGDGCLNGFFGVEKKKTFVAPNSQIFWVKTIKAYKSFVDWGGVIHWFLFFKKKIPWRTGHDPWIRKRKVSLFRFVICCQATRIFTGHKETPTKHLQDTGTIHFADDLSCVPTAMMLLTHHVM